MKKLISIIILLAMLVYSFGIFASADEPADIDVPETNEENTDEETQQLVTSSEGLLPFEDIDPASWYVEGLTFCYSNGIISGAGNTYTFNPKGELTRATFAVMLARAIGADLSVTSWNTFSDCDYSENSWYAKAVEWAALNGYMNGTGEGVFSPNVTMTREQLATVFMRFMQKAEYEVEVSEDVLAEYTDVSGISDWAVDGVKYAVSAGLISSTSTSNKVASPKMSVTREQAVKLFTSFLRTYFFGSCEHQFSQATCTEASVCSECGMVDMMATGHLCIGLSCKDGATCTVCALEVLPDGGLHVYVPANCTTDETCGVCGATRQGAFGHKFTAATCVTPATCTRCGEIDGEVAGHNVVNKKCTVCSFNAFRIAAERLTELEGITSVTDAAGDRFEYILWYDDTTDELCFTLFHYYSYGDSDVVMFSVNSIDNTCQFDYEYYLNDEELFFDGMGKFDSTVFDSSAEISFSTYEGNASDVATALSNVKILGDTMLTASVTLVPQFIADVELSMLGFAKY
ncbi:MAG: S-layer homology domain-containing protein [Clostridia bacterium]|nr:S-layer homology domain-containing protein [Clostridia bacterium]